MAKIDVTQTYHLSLTESEAKALLILLDDGINTATQLDSSVNADLLEIQRALKLYIYNY